MAYVNIGCYYIVGVPLGALLGFVFKLGVKVNGITGVLFFVYLVQDYQL